VNYFKKIYNEKLLDKKALLKKWRIGEFNKDADHQEIARKYKGVIKKKKRDGKHERKLSQ